MNRFKLQETATPSDFTGVAAAVDIWCGDFNMKKSIPTRFVATLPVVLALAIFFGANPLAEPRLEAAPNQESITEYYALSLTPRSTSVNFLFLYIANPDVAANLPAYRAPIPQPVADCLEQHVPRAAPMRRSNNTWRRRRLAVVKTGSAPGPMCARRRRNGSTWHRLDTRLPEQIR